MNTTDANADDTQNPNPLHLLPAPLGGSFHRTVKRALVERIALVRELDKDQELSAQDAPPAGTTIDPDAPLLAAANAALVKLVDRQVVHFAEYPTWVRRDGYAFDGIDADLYELGMLVRVLRLIDGVAPLVQVAIKMLGFFRQLRGHDEALAHQLCAGIVDDLLASGGEGPAQLQTLRPICTSIMVLLTRPWQVERQRVEWATRRVALRKARKHWPKAIGVPGVCKEEWFEFYDRNPHHLPDVEKAIEALKEGSRNEAFTRSQLSPDEPMQVLYEKASVLPVWNPCNYCFAAPEVVAAREQSGVVDLVLKLGSFLHTSYDPEHQFTHLELDPLGFVREPDRPPAADVVVEPARQLARLRIGRAVPAEEIDAML